MPVRIYGAGMAGLLTSAMLRRLRPVVYEAQSTLPDNHGALLRFRTSAVERETGQPFRKVNVLKAVKSGGTLRHEATIRDANQYSYKVTGQVQPRSVLNLDPCDRYIAPDTFINDMARDAILKMNAPLTREALEQNNEEGVTTITTIPMPVMMKMVGWDNPGFRWRPVWSMRVELLDVDVYQTIYYPEGNVPYYRASITGSQLIVEYMDEPTTDTNALAGQAVDVMHDFGISTEGAWKMTPPKRQEYGKLVPLDKSARQTFILALTDQYNCYSVGRFATWRQILLDDVVQDVRRVETWITQRTTYERRLDRV